jgi:hypothetical protein
VFSRPTMMPIFLVKFPSFFPVGSLQFAVSSSDERQ